MTKKACRINTKYVENGKTTKDFGAFCPSDKYAIRKALLGSIKTEDAKKLHQQLIEGYIYPSDQHTGRWGTEKRYDYYTRTHKRPVVEKWYIEEPVFFHELINEIVAQNNEALCETLLGALEHISVTDINLKKLYAFDKVAINASLEGLGKYIQSEDHTVSKKSIMKKLHQDLKSILNHEDNPKEKAAPTTSIYPNLKEHLKPTVNPLLERVKAIKCKLDMYQCLHQYDAVLEKHREPKLLRIIGEILVALCTGFTFHLIHRPLTGKWSFFNNETASMGAVNEVDKAIFTSRESADKMVFLTKP